ncbi:hypothetical protein [Alkalimarinus alittae]|uniref:Uncharacterized protein n=1 Tax=Alkalimarinus alittae TaxID=2961619 RepID=A0ABY6N586_9ALTE|nr:hypothetical protein [Alkalimarinus alittae]UZE97278.1 hypothetical protein NKI27_05875 [Alkalimarinus alittae]
MTVMYHPSKDNPQRIRVLDKELGIQEYFSFSILGKKKATRLAEERQAEIDRRKHIRRLQHDLAINKLFKEDGSIKGLSKRRRSRSKKEIELLSLQVVVDKGVQKHKEISLNCRSFDEAWEMLRSALLEIHKTEATYEINELFRNARRHYW